jgi:hypothetical protein
MNPAVPGFVSESVYFKRENKIDMITALSNESKMNDMMQITLWRTNKTRGMSPFNIPFIGK